MRIDHARELQLDQVHDNPLQPRDSMNADVVAGVCAAIQDAQRYPVSLAITVRPRTAGGWEIISGHHRATAARESELDTIWAHVQDLDDREAAIALAATNNQAEMTTFEHARHALLLSEQFGVTVREYSRMIGRAETSMSHAIKAYRVLSEHGGPGGPNGQVPLGALSALATVDNDAQRAGLLYQFRERRSTNAEAEGVIALVRQGVQMRAAFDQVEGKPAPGSGTKTGPNRHASDSTAVAASQANLELMAAFEWTLSLYQAWTEVLEERFAAQLKAERDKLTAEVAVRQRWILRELRAEPSSRLEKPVTEEPACATCAHGRVSKLSEIGWTCNASRAAGCQPLSHRRFWVAKED